MVSESKLILSRADLQKLLEGAFPSLVAGWS